MFREGSDILGRMVTEMYVRGLSTRDVENMFIQTLGQRLLSRSSVSRITRCLQKDFDIWRRRDLSGLKVLYLFLDAIYLPLRQGVKEKEGVLRSQVPVVVDFWAPWCRPCQMIAPLTEELAEDYEGRVKFCKLNVDQNPQMATRYGVMSIPFLLFFKGGQPVDQVVGAVTESKLRPEVEELI